ncbi:MAG TPA: hypothetical protein DCM32_05640 [Xanthomonadaceae bacterium]|jgi:hypothetical protein|nr:hypothetical protein [Xanthomonadaceae bacterium]
MAKLSRDRTVATLHPRENLHATGVLAANAAEVIVDAHGCASFALDLRGTATLTVEVSGTADGTNWAAIAIRPINQVGTRYVVAPAFAGATAGTWKGSCAGYDRVRVRVTAYTSGSLVATLLASTAPLDQSLVGTTTTDAVTAVGTAGAAVTLTLPSPGTGLRHYITYLSMTRFAAAALTAAATPVTITTTNLPGALAFSFPADAALQGSTTFLREDFAVPIASSAQATATTVVLPATTGVIWRATAGFYPAP